MTTEISFNVTQGEAVTITAIATRANILAAGAGVEYGQMEAEMDVTAVHANGCPLRLGDLLKADDFNFGHDVFGIRQHIDRTTGNLSDHFWPRYAAPEPPPVAGASDTEHPHAEPWWTRPLAVGVYEATDKFRSIERHTCVMYDDGSGGLVAVTGPDQDDESIGYAFLFAHAPKLVEQCKDLLSAAKGVLEEYEDTLDSMDSGGTAGRLSSWNAAKLRNAIRKAGGAS